MCCGVGHRLVIHVVNQDLKIQIGAQQFSILSLNLFFIVYQAKSLKPAVHVNSYVLITYFFKLNN